ncbi:MAG: ABC transporter substrate-binding protein [Candidatus Paceibacterota bacterium]
MNKQITWAIVAIVIISLVVWGVRSSGSKTQNDANPIRIGILNSLTGSAAPWGEAAKNGVDLAVKEINSKGGINGRLVEAVTEDDHTDGKQALSAYNKLVSIDDVQGVVGGVFDFSAIPIEPLALNNRVAFVSPQNFRMPGGFMGNEQSFVMMTDFSTVIRVAKEYLAASGVKKLAVVHFTSAWGNEISRTLDTVMKELGKGGVIDDSYTQIGGNDFRTTVAKLKSQGVDAVFLDMLGDDPLNFLKRSKELGFVPKVITYNGALDAFAGVNDKSLIEGVVILNWEIYGKDFEVLYRNEYNSEPSKSSDKWFDAIYVMANAIANSTSTEGVASYIASHTFTTPNATIAFTADHTVNSTPVEIQVIKDGKQVPWVK